jgi:hypothetical protein
MVSVLFFTSPKNKTDTVFLNYKGLSANDSFSTYLMFQPSQPVWYGVWIALAQVDWSWNLSANFTSGSWPPPFTKPQPVPVVMAAPSGGNEFPPWVNTGANYWSPTIDPPWPGL